MEPNTIATILSIVGFFGSIASLVGVYYSYKQSQQALTAAEAAQNAVQNVLDKKRLSVFNEIIDFGHKVENELNRQWGKKDPKFGAKINNATMAIDNFISVVNEKKHNLPTNKKDSIEKSLKVINDYRKEFNDEYILLSQAIEQILQHTQNIITEVSEEKQEKEYKTTKHNS